MGIPSDAELEKQAQDEADVLEIGAAPDNDNGSGDDLEVGAPETREQRKKNRFREAHERAERAEKAALGAEERTKALEQEVLQQRQYLQRMSAPQQQQEDPLELGIKQNREARRSLELEYEHAVERYRRSKQEMPAAEYEKFRERAEQVDDHRSVLAAHRAMRASQPDPDQQARASIGRILAAENKDVYEHGKAMLWSKGRYAQYQADGHGDSRELHDRVMDEARERFGMKARKARYEAPDEERRSRYTGAGKGAAPSASGGQKFTMDSLHKTLADERFSYIKDPKQRYQKYVNEVGSKLVNKK